MKDKIKNIWKSRAALMVDQEKEHVYVEMTEDNFNDVIAETVKLFAIPDVNKPKGTVCPSKDRCVGFMESECFANTSLKYGCYRAK